MHDVLRELSTLDLPLLPPASPDELQRLETALGAALPPEITQLYQHHGGMSPEAIFPMRFMSPAEAIDAHHEFTETAGPGSTDPIGLFWTDDNANYAGVFLTGELSGRVCVLDHEELEDTPRYWSVESFCRHLIDGHREDLHWTEIAQDYPVLDPELQYPSIGPDAALARNYLQLMEESTERRATVRYAFRAMNLLPPADSHRIVPLLRSSDMWIQERACQVLGKRKHADAADDLYDVARNGMHNGRIASIIALKQIATPAAREYLDRLRDELDPSYEIWFR